MTEDFFSSAIRHLEDGRYLARDGRFDNAVCHYGFSAECALKCLTHALEINLSMKKYGHKGGRLWEDLCVRLKNSSAISILGPALGIKLSFRPLSPKLFESHPDRRYAASGTYIESDAFECERSASFLVEELITLKINGYNL